MSDSIEIVSNATDILRRIEGMPERLQGAVKRGFARGLLLIEDAWKRDTAVRLTGGRSGLASRLTSFVRDEQGGRSVAGYIGFRKTKGFPYEMAQETGAKARPGHAMAIPISKEARALSERGVSAKDFPRPLVRPGKSRILVEWRYRGARRGAGAGTLSHAVMHYVLVKSIPARLRFRESVTRNVPIAASEVVHEWRSNR